MSDDRVIELGAHERMTPEEALAKCSREEWEQVIIIGFHRDHNGLIVRSSHMSLEAALWIIENAKLHVMDVR